MNLLALPVFALMGVVFHELFVRMHIVTDIRRVLQVAPAAVRVIRSDTLSDLEKERTVRRMSVDVLRDTARFTVKLALVLGVCLAIAALAQALFDVSPDGLEGLLTSWWALAALLVVMPVYARLRASGLSDARLVDADAERSDDTRSDGNAVPVAERSRDHRPDELAVPVAGRSDDRRPDDGAPPTLERSGDRRPDDSALPTAERSGDRRPDDGAVSIHHPSPDPEDRSTSSSSVERTERAHPAPEHG